jgi:hypothetical protein
MGGVVVSWFCWLSFKNRACEAAGSQVSKFVRYSNLPISARNLEGRAGNLAIKSNQAAIVLLALLAVIVATAAIDVGTFNAFSLAAILIVWFGVLATYLHWISQP